MGRREEKAKKQRAAITAAAVSVFSKKGFHRASVEEIARKAGVGKGTIYLYFDDKSRLFAAAVAEGIENIIRELKVTLELDLRFPLHLKKLMERNVELYLEYGDLTKIFTNELSSGLEKKVRAEIEAVREHYIEFLADTLKYGHERGYLRQIDFRLAAIAMLGTLDSLCNHTLKNRDVDRDKLLETVYALLMTGLVAEDKVKR